MPVHSAERRSDARLAFFWSVLAMAAAAAVVPYLFAVTPGLETAVREELEAPLWVVAVAQAMQTGAIAFALTWIGLRIARPLGLDSPLARALLDQRPLPRVGRTLAGAALIGVVVGLLALALDAGVLERLQPLPKVDVVTVVPRWKGLLAALYGGITEELYSRAFLMTLLVWIATKVLGPAERDTASIGRAVLPPTGSAVWFGIGGSALLFAAGHLPTAAAVWGLGPAVLVRILVLNGLASVPFGWLYARRGLEHAMVAHLAADLILHGIAGA